MIPTYIVHSTKEFLVPSQVACSWTPVVAITVCSGWCHRESTLLHNGLPESIGGLVISLGIHSVSGEVSLLFPLVRSLCLNCAMANEPTTVVQA
jgi:hypothetical protein